MQYKEQYNKFLEFLWRALFSDYRFCARIFLKKTIKYLSTFYLFMRSRRLNCRRSKTVTDCSLYYAINLGNLG